MALYRHFGYPLSSLFFLNRETGTLSVLLGLFLGSALNFSHIRKILPALEMSQSLPILAGAILLLVCTAIPEELFYRRILQTRMEKVGGWLFSIVGSALLFSSFHFPSRYLLSTGVEGAAGDVAGIVSGTLVPTFLLGLVFGFLWNRYRNVFLLIALHYGIDFLPAVSSILGVMK